MLDALRSILNPAQKGSARLPRVPKGARYYVIGDIHGRLDLYDSLIDAIERDIVSRPRREARVVLLGDLIDRGPDSAGVIRRTRNWQKHRDVRVLAGNHEEMFLDSFEKPEVLRHYLKHGGRETFMSYGMAKADLATMTLDDLFEAIPNVVPQDDIAYVKSFEDCIAAGDYLFVHAGIDPNVPLDQQDRKDMLWIRDRFLDYEGPLEKVVVHGHTIFDSVMDCGNRIGIDTGAFRSGVLTALVLEGNQRRVMQAIASDESPIEVVHSDCGT